MHENVAEEAKFGFQAGNAEWRLIKLDLLFIESMGSVVTAKNIQRAVGYSFKDCFNVGFRAQMADSSCSCCQKCEGTRP